MSIRTPAKWYPLLLALTLFGCAGIGVKRTDGPDLFKAWRLSAVHKDHVSARTLQTLRALDLDLLYHEAPAEAFAQLQAAAEKDPQPDLLFALAEISYLLGQKIEKTVCAQCIGYYYLSAGYAFHYLYGKPSATDQVTGVARAGRAEVGLERFDSRASPFDPRFRLACDLYNAGLAKCIRAAQRVGRLDPRQALQLSVCGDRSLTLSVVHAGFLWKPEEFGELLFSEDYRSTGLANHHRTHGLGVPLIAIRSNKVPTPPSANYPPSVSFPVTAFFRFEGTVADLRTQRGGRLELYNPLTVQAVQVQGVYTPLETDLTTPLAFLLANTRLEEAGYLGFLRPEKIQQHTGLYLLEPYQPGKIPVIMVHGLLSSPVTWAPMFNDLRADPQLRERYQFWFYFYPTANPYLATASDLRRSLGELRQELDPQRRDPALDNMVFVGHSMGGLISRLLTVDGGDDFWGLVSEQPFAELKAGEGTRQVLQQVFYFQRRPCVKRVIFIGSPHRGSKLSPAVPGRIARYFIRLPKNLSNVVQDVATQNPDFLTGVDPGRIPTSVDLLAPDSPALTLLADRPKPKNVYYHSIVGIAPPSPYVFLTRLLAGANRCEPGDGVVPYSSAHLDIADSEYVVPADHDSVHQHPLSIQEVRRLLLEHVADR